MEKYAQKEVVQNFIHVYRTQRIVVLIYCYDYLIYSCLMSLSENQVLILKCSAFNYLKVL